MRTRLVALGCVALLVAACGGAAAPAPRSSPGAVAASPAGTPGPVKVGAFPSKQLRIMAPANPGGGWDQTTRAMQAALQEAKIAAQPVEAFNRPGAGGTVGLAEMANQHRGDGHTVMTMGFVMVGSILTNKAPVDLKQTTPIARLTTEYQAIAVGKDSKYQNIKQLLDDFKANPRSIRWGGGSAGGVDHITIALIAQSLGIPTKDINYIAFSGGGELMPQVLGNQVTAGVSGFGEFKGQAASGGVRILAVSAPQKIQGSTAPTLKESGTNVEISNWRGIVGPREMPAEHRQAWVTMLERAVASPQWKESLKKNDWTDAFLAGDPFVAFVRSEEERVGKLLKELGLVQ